MPENGLVEPNLAVESARRASSPSRWPSQGWLAFCHPYHPGGHNGAYPRLLSSSQFGLLDGDYQGGGRSRATFRHPGGLLEGS